MTGNRKLARTYEDWADGTTQRTHAVDQSYACRCFPACTGTLPEASLRHGCDRHAACCKHMQCKMLMRLYVAEEGPCL